MAEVLFFMQRYFGSDEESEESHVKNNDNFKPKRKKIKTSLSQETDKYNNANEDNILQEERSVKTESKLENNSDFTNIVSNLDIEALKVQEIEQVIENNSLKTKDAKRKGNKRKSSKKIKSESLEKKCIKKEENFCVIGQKKTQNIEKIKPALPKWLSNPSIISIDLKEQEMPITELPYIDERSKKSLAESGIKFLFPVQLSVIPWLMDANENSLLIRPSDLCVSAPTGSGKTLAFVIPIVQSLKDRVVCAIRALVVLPVSELAIQVHKVFETFVKNTDLKVVLLTGQKSFTAEQNLLVREGTNRTLSLADIIVTTPGRILDHISRTKGFNLQKLRYLVVDEADRMMEDIQKGWLKQIEDAVYKEAPNSSCACFSIENKRTSSFQSTACSFRQINLPLQKLLYSATLSHDPEKLHSLSLYRPKLFVTQKTDSEDWIGKCPIPKDLILKHIICDAATKPLVLCHYIRKNKFKKTLCFTESVERAQRLHFILEEMKFLKSREISSNYRPVQRKIILEQFSSGKIDIIVCSDLVARGMDIAGVDCVISYDVPSFLKTYIHRVGRTARAGKSGTAVALVTRDEIPRFKKMLVSSDMSMPDNVCIDTQELQEYVPAFQQALKAVDSNLRKFKSEKNRRKSSKKKLQDQPKILLT